MLEASAENVHQPLFKKAIKKGVKEALQISLAIDRFSAQYGKEKRALPEIPALPDEVKEAINVWVNYIQWTKKVDNTHPPDAFVGDTSEQIDLGIWTPMKSGHYLETPIELHNSLHQIYISQL